MGLCAQIGLLMWKNGMLMWRRKFVTFVEFVLPLLFAGILLLIKNDTNVSEGREYEPFPISGGALDIKNISSRSTNSFELGYSFEPGLEAQAVQLMDKVAKRYEDGEGKPVIELYKKADRGQLVEFLNRTDEEQWTPRDHRIGVYFTRIRSSESDSESPELHYIFLKQRSDWYIPLGSFWRGNDPTTSDDYFGSSRSQYWYDGLLSFQLAIDLSFIGGTTTKASVANDIPDFFLQQLPRERTQMSNMAYVVREAPLVFQMFWLLPLLFIMLFLANKLVVEKESGIKTYMSVMGLHPMAFYQSHLIFGQIKVLAVMTVFAIVLSTKLQFVNPVILIVLAVLYGFAMLYLATLTTTIVRTHQLCQLILLIVALTCLVLALQLLPEPKQQLGLCVLASLNPIAAFRLGMEEMFYYEHKMHPFGISSLFPGTAGLAILMLIVDCLLFNAFIYYLDAVVPTDDSPKKHPLFFLPKFASKDKALKGQQNGGFDWNNGDNNDVNGSSTKIPVENMEPEQAQQTQLNSRTNIDVRNMSKKWGTKMAVNNLCFRARQGQITVLLGHNGAGKTTTFSVITGSIRCTSGRVLICGQDLATNLGECRKKIGYCPQNNPLFDSLTVREHLRLYAGLKSSTFNGPLGKAALERESADLLEQVGLADKSATEAGKLSGGQKRKLCVAIALVGNSQVVLLDEPTAGMDVQARAEVGELLAEVKKNRTILLTTHYMEEADKLGDRIGIMVDGRLRCCGSPEFLKTRFGVGYILSLVCTGFDGKTASHSGSFSDAVQKILHVVRQHSSNAKLERVSAPELKVLLPSADKKRFADLFDALEQDKQRLAISSFGLSENTLEEVFLKVGEIDENGHNGGEGQSRKKERTADTVQEAVQEIFNTNRRQTKSGILLCLQQLLALQQRQLLWTLRNPLRSLTPLAIAVLFFLLIGFVTNPIQTNMQQYRVNKLSLSMDDVKESVKVVAQLGTGEPYRSQFQALFDHLCPKCSLVQLIPSDTDADLQAALLNEQWQSPPYIAAGVDVGTGTGMVKAIYNAVARHTQPMALSMVTNGLLGANSFAIRPSIELFDDYDNFAHADDQYAKRYEAMWQNMLAGLAICVCFAIFHATMAVPMVQERSASFKYQLLLTQLHVFTYWVAVFLWNLLFYALFCLLILSFLFAFGWMQGGRADLCFVWALFLWAYVPMNALLSFLFTRGQRAFTVLLIYDFIIANILMAIPMGLRLAWNMVALADFLETVFLMFAPGFSLFDAVIRILSRTNKGSDIGLSTSWDKNIWTMLASGFLFWTLVAVLESRRIGTMFNRLKHQLVFIGTFQAKNPSSSYDVEKSQHQEEDPDVRAECQRVQQQQMPATDLALAVCALGKFYGNFPAVHELTFGVQRQECFGLLGPNGAGKTTTFDILTGFQHASSGQATIAGVDVCSGPSIGYCPQFDALPLDLTGREVLTLLARLNGFTAAKDHVDRVLWCIRMEAEADRKVEQYSGGQRRRISVGVTLLTRSSVLMLDEPTAGIDPIARRHIWQILHAATRQQHMAMLLTSHSMDECEELCTRIGFMNRGRLIGIGSGQHLKSRFGNSYLLTITVSNPNQSVGHLLNNVVVERLNALPTVDPTTAAVLHWEIPKREEAVPWAVLYRKAQQLADDYAKGKPNDASVAVANAHQQPVILDFSLTQNSLEQVFLRLSAMKM